jgi:hypothetical protein
MAAQPSEGDGRVSLPTEVIVSRSRDFSTISKGNSFCSTLETSVFEAFLLLQQLWLESQSSWEEDLLDIT